MLLPRDIPGGSVIPSVVQLIPIALQLIKGVQQLLKWHAPADPYRFVEYDATLELNGQGGKSALLTKRERVQYLQDDVQTLEDYAWGSGNVLENYKCTPGVVVDRYQDGDRWKLLISLRQTKKRGEMETFHIQRRLLNVFTKREGWWQVEMRHQTDSLKLSIIFPRDRHPRKASLSERTQNNTISMNESWADLPDGRRLLTWATDQPRKFETYTFKWQW